MDRRFLPKHDNCLGKNCNIWAIPFLKGKKMCVKLMRTGIEVIKKLKPTTIPKGCRSF